MSVEELTKEQVQMLRKAFDMFDREKRGCIHTNMVSTILRTLGQSFEEKELQALIKEIDADGKFRVTCTYITNDKYKCVLDYNRYQNSNISMLNRLYQSFRIR